MSNEGPKLTISVSSMIGTAVMGTDVRRNPKGGGETLQRREARHHGASSAE